jgi:DNA primase
MQMSETNPIRRVLKELRGFTDETLGIRQIGWDQERITIPIYDEYNELVNIRRYKWNAATGAEKMKNFVDELGNAYGELRIYGIENLLNPEIEEIIWNEGETDRIVLEQNGFKACTPTSGSGSFRPEWTKLFKGKKKLYILQDNDEAGENGAIAIAERLYRMVPTFIVKWPEGFLEKGDPTDWFVKCQRSKEDLQLLLDKAPQYKMHTTEEASEVVDVTLAQSSNFEYIGKKQRIPIMVSGKDTAPYVAPKKVKITCTPDGKIVSFVRMRHMEENKYSNLKLACLKR